MSKSFTPSPTCKQYLNKDLEGEAADLVVKHLKRLSDDKPRYTCLQTSYQHHHYSFLLQLLWALYNNDRNNKNNNNNTDESSFETNVRKKLRGK